MNCIASRRVHSGACVVLLSTLFSGCASQGLVDQQRPSNALYTPATAMEWPEQLVNTAPEVPLEVAPVEPQVITDLWVHLRNNMHLDLHLDQRRVQQEIAWIKRHPKYLQRLQSRLQTYLPYVYRETALRNMPLELALLPIVESALDVYAFSHGGAAGPWQFIRGTARQYGLVMDGWYDGRRDIVASTDAALRLLTDLHNRYDDWYLALAGYNAGPGNVNKALRRNPDATFFDLKLPRETQAYVPRLLAIAAVIKDPQRYNITLPTVENEAQFTTVDLGGQFQIDKVAAAVGLPIEELKRWNPAFSRWATSPKGPHRMIVPLSLDTARAQAALNAVPNRQRLDWNEIKVKPGDTLSHIARRYRTDVASLKSANRLASNSIRQGQTLLIPVAGQKEPPPVLTGAVHTVAQGESLWSISRKYNVNLRKLMILNHVGPKDPLTVGKQLKLPGGALQTDKVVRTVRYKVRRGDSLARIAAKFNVTIQQITNWNKLDPRKYLQPGQGLLVHVNVTSNH